MSIKTKIQWTDSTVNPTVGCDGCELWNEKQKICYAGKMTKRFGKSNPGLADRFEEVDTRPGKMADAAGWSDQTRKPRWTKSWLHDLPRLIFVGDMADNFSAAISFEYLHDEVIAAATSEKGQRHQWQWLTKQPRRMAKFSKWLSSEGIVWPNNLWVGTSVTTQSTLKRIDHLHRVGDETTLHFVSVEPQWEYIELGRHLEKLDWVIQGGESDSMKHPFDLAWAESLQKECRKARVPYFLKQLGTHVVSDGQRVKLVDKHGENWREWPEQLCVRQMPIYVGRRPGGRRVRRRNVELE